MADELTPLIQWHDGMALSPHHFQQKDLRDQQVLSRHLQYLTPFHYGIQDLSIDSVALPSGQFRILKADIAMPDGTVAFFDAQKDGKSLSLDLQEHRETLLNREGTVFLLLPTRAVNVSPVLGALPRFSSIEGSPVKDENTDDNPLTIARLIPNFSLALTETLPVKYTGFPIAKVKFSDNSFQLLDFVPPCFYLPSQSSILQKARLLAQRLREKIQSLNEKWQNQIGSNLLNETSDILRPLMAMLPSLESLVRESQLSPVQLYQELIHDVGLAAQLNLSQIPESYPNYCHTNIKQSLEPLMDAIMENLDHVSLEYAIFPFIHNDRIFSFKLHKAYFQNHELIIGLKAKPGTHPKKIENWMNSAVIVSDSAIQSVKEKRVLGAARNLIQDDRLYKMSSPRSISLFSVEIDSEFVKPNQYLHIFNQSDTEEDRPLDIVMYVQKYQEESQATQTAA